MTEQEKKEIGEAFERFFEQCQPVQMTQEEIDLEASSSVLQQGLLQAGIEHRRFLEEKGLI